MTDFNIIEVDHIIPKTLGKTAFEVTKADHGLATDFNVRAVANLAPSAQDDAVRLATSSCAMLHEKVIGTNDCRAWYGHGHQYARGTAGVVAPKVSDPLIGWDRRR